MKVGFIGVGNMVAPCAATSSSAATTRSRVRPERRRPQDLHRPRRQQPTKSVAEVTRGADVRETSCPCPRTSRP